MLDAGVGAGHAAAAPPAAHRRAERDGKHGGTVARGLRQVNRPALLRGGPRHGPQPADLLRRMGAGAGVRDGPGTGGRLRGARGRRRQPARPACRFGVGAPGLAVRLPHRLGPDGRQVRRGHRGSRRAGGAAGRPRGAGGAGGLRGGRGDHLRPRHAGQQGVGGGPGRGRAHRREECGRQELHRGRGGLRRGCRSPGGRAPRPIALPRAGAPGRNAPRPFGPSASASASSRKLPTVGWTPSARATLLRRRR